MTPIARLPLVLAAAVFAMSPAHAADAAQPTPRVIVTGQGEVAVAPDMALVNLSVMREAPTAREALDEANAAMASVIAALREAGIESRDLQTSGLQIQPRYVYPQSGGTEQPRIVAYQVSNTLSVRVRDITQVGTVIDRAVTLGVNQGGDISFRNDDPSAAMTEARRLAVQDAVARARTLADAAGVNLGRVLEISEQSHGAQPMPIDAKVMRMEAADAVPVEAGENTYRVHVNVTFEIGG